MERYSNGQIYRLLGEDGYFYIGSTCMPLYKRLHNHKADAKRRPNKVYNHFNTLGWDKVKIILIEEYSCQNKQQLLKREQEEIDKYKTNDKCLNTYNSCGYDKERDVISKARWWEEHKDEINRKRREEKSGKKIVSTVIDDAIGEGTQG